MPTKYLIGFKKIEHVGSFKLLNKGSDYEIVEEFKGGFIVHMNGDQSQAIAKFEKLTKHIKNDDTNTTTNCTSEA